MHTAVGVVAQHRVDELGNHLLEFCHKLLRTVGVVLDLAQLVFPDAREFRTLEEFLLDQPDEGLRPWEWLPNSCAADGCSRACRAFG